MTIPKTQPLVTVCMATFNSEATVERAIKSVLGQTHKNLELLVVDANSTDATRAILQDIAAEDPRLRPILRTVQTPYVAAFRDALSLGTGEFFCLVDGDDFVSRAWVASLLEPLLDSDAYIGAIGQLIHCDLEGALVRQHPSSGRVFGFASNSQRSSRLFGMAVRPDSAGSVNLLYSLWRMDAIQAIGAWSVNGERRDDDYLLCLRALGRGPIASVPGAWICRTLPTSRSEDSSILVSETDEASTFCPPPRLRLQDWTFPFVRQSIRFMNLDIRNVILAPALLLRCGVALVALPMRLLRTVQRKARLAADGIPVGK